MTRKDFGQYCGLARALELVGERWALLVVRELLARPSRYTDLLSDLPGIPTNMLSTRLRELEESGIVERRVAPVGQRGVLYALTKDGEALQAAVLTLAKWGNAHLGEQKAGEQVPPSSLAMTLRATFNPAAAKDMAASWEIHAGGMILYAVVADGAVTTGIGPAPTDPDLVVTMRSEQVPTFRALLGAMANGEVETAGKSRLLETFVRVFAPPAAVGAYVAGSSS